MSRASRGTGAGADAGAALGAARVSVLLVDIAAATTRWARAAALGPQRLNSPTV